MKIICEKGYHAGNVLRLVAEYLEKRYPDDMILDENMEITLSLKNGENGQSIVLGEKELQLSHHTADHSEDYYNHDVLTHLYTRCKYEHDLKVFQLANYARLTCIYMDAVGLHEINNHLGHEAGDHMLRSIADGIRSISRMTARIVSAVTSLSCCVRRVSRRSLQKALRRSVTQSVRWVMRSRSACLRARTDRR